MFDYFSILVSIILGLALTHLLRGLGKQIQMSRQIRVYWVHILWTINVVFQVLVLWWGMFWWKYLSTWPISWFVFLSTYAVVLFLWSYMLYPAEVPEGIDFEVFFYRNRRWFFGLLIASFLMDIPETMGKQLYHLRPMPAFYPYLVAVLLLIGVVGMVSSNRRLHAVMATLWFAILASYVSLSVIAHIGPQQ
ncbi:MAG: hypothetical protein JOZ03_13085 [Gammaproteobacteria bacterium]|nr:hypothetical protein [Gammaproteobacteria bacterium]